MSSIRVKDLAKELGVGNKEILQFLRELGFQAKSQMGALTEEEVVQVRAKARSLVGKTQVIDTEVQPGVIVRRRKPARDKAPEAAPEVDAAPPADHVPVEPEPLEPPVIEVTAEPQTPEAAPAVSTEELAPRKARPARHTPVETTARIISQP
ncbi:translation initiation factor IF-2, partial [Desulfovibrio sulfodismutans]|nr:translation initiation factor IF-2 [Desulfolutivibrio sulfodismutans]